MWKVGWLVQKALKSLFFSLPKMYYHHVQKVHIPVNILLSPPLLQSVQLTNVARLSCMCIWYYYRYYLKKNLEKVIVKGRNGLMMHHHNLTDTLFRFLFLFCQIEAISGRTRRCICKLDHVFCFWQYLGLYLRSVHFLFFILVLCFCKYTEVFHGFWIC